ncbi:hypothetical protein M9980_02515 [Sphingomonas donggukensis]|uniref:Uncharacterized protein n=1 Tax=Sphingomonas donggukensis TaxID=2949093 RepID=A0ABY4TUP3_9SPHN|nr:hypothetical protein [Sphingomonas donggukensis]URW76124.1 hypothetical protein M9980_02515 [Sphingomonas donggukensis]
MAAIPLPRRRLHAASTALAMAVVAGWSMVALSLPTIARILSALPPTWRDAVLAVATTFAIGVSAYALAHAVRRWQRPPPRRPANDNAPYPSPAFDWSPIATPEAPMAIARR